MANPLSPPVANEPLTWSVGCGLIET